MSLRAVTAQPLALLATAAPAFASLAKRLQPPHRRLRLLQQQLWPSHQQLLPSHRRLRHPHQRLQFSHQWLRISGTGFRSSGSGLYGDDTFMAELAALPDQNEAEEEKVTGTW